MELATEKKYCSNCSALIQGAYCSQCGQRYFSSHNLSLRYFIASAAKEFANIDGKFFRTMWVLLTKPGKLTAEYLTGKQKQYVKPISLFLFVNVFFFFFGYEIGLLHWSMENSLGKEGRAYIEQRAIANGKDVQEYTRVLDVHFSRYQRSMFFGIIPLFAVGMYIMLYRKKRYFMEYLIYSIHYHSAYLILLPVTAVVIVGTLGVIDKIFSTHLAQLFGNDPILGYYAVTLMILYHCAALRTVFHESFFNAFMKATLLSVFSGYISVALAERMLFWLTLYTTA